MKNTNRVLKILGHPATFMALGAFWLIVAAFQWPLGMDEARWGYVAHQWVHYAAPPYKAVIENKPPAIYILFAISDFLFGPQCWFPRMIGVFCLLVTSFLLYRIGKTWRDAWTGMTAIVVYLFASAWLSFDGPWTTQTETFINLFTSLAFYCVATSPPNNKNTSRRFLLAGFFMGCAIAFKQTAIFSVAALCFFVMTDTTEEKNVRHAFWSPLLYLGGGITLATLGSLAPLRISGVSFRDYIEGCWLLILKPGTSSFNSDPDVHPGTWASWSVRLHSFPSSMARIDTAIFFICLLYLLRKRKVLTGDKIPMKGLLAWMLCDFVAVHGSGYYFPHQFKQLLPSLALAIALSLRTFISDFHLKNSRREEATQVGVLCFLVILMSLNPQMPRVDRTINRILHLTRSPEEVVGQWLKVHTDKEDYVYSFGKRAHVVLFYSNRRSSSRYYNYFYINSASIPEVVQDLTFNKRPSFIILQDNQAPDWLWHVVGGFSRYRTNMAGYWIYENAKLLSQK